MAVGKNKKLGKKKKGVRRTDPFTRKEWYTVRTPASFEVRDLGKTFVTKTMGTRTAREGLLGRVFQASLGDLTQAPTEEAYRKFSFKVEEVSGTQCLTSFHGMELTTDKQKSLVRKWHTLIEAYVDVKTTDGYSLRIFCIGFTKRARGMLKRAAYATSAQIRVIRKNMVEIMRREAEACDLNELLQKLKTETIGREIEKACNGVYPLQNVFMRKVKLLRAPKLDVSKLLESHGGAEAIAAVEASKKVDRPVVVEAAPAKKVVAKKGGKKGKKGEE